MRRRLVRVVHDAQLAASLLCDACAARFGCRLRTSFPAPSNGLPILPNLITSLG